jgi:hypothetical protein
MREQTTEQKRREGIGIRLLLGGIIFLLLIAVIACFSVSFVWGCVLMGAITTVAGGVMWLTADPDW